ncbi:MAG: hydrogenase 4 subunit F [Acidobacteriota bacterium]|jgi:hydrogenase-4 component F|nr:hydrogenase 4 subunit F [Acidobacteriota bacterium]
MELPTLIIFLVAAPLLAAVLMAALPSRLLPSLFYEAIHMASVAVVCALSCYLAFVAATGNEAIYALGGWLYLDALGAVFIFIIGAIGLLTGWHSLSSIRHDLEEGAFTPSRLKQYYVFFNLFVFTMLMVALSNNVITMWVAVEATTLATVFMVGAYNTKLSLEAAWKYVIVCTVGVAFGLYGTLLVYANAADIMPDPHQAVFWTSLMPYAPQFDAMLIQIAFVFVVIGFGTKAGLFPMHTWLPDAYSEAPGSASALLSGASSKCAVLIIIRFYTIAVETVGSSFPQIIMMSIGILSVVLAAFAVFRQDDLKRKLAYSSVKNIGIVALCLGFGGPYGVAAALLHCVMHGFTKALVFCLSGSVQAKYKTRDLTKIKGIIEAAPATAVLMIIGLIALSGFPLSAMFISEVMAFVAGVVSGSIGLVIILGLALAIVIAAFMLVIAKSVLGKAPDGMKKKNSGVATLIPEAILAAVIIWFGVAPPPPMIRGIEAATAIVLHHKEGDVFDVPILKYLFASAGSSGRATGE